ncbi:Uncharacterized conserved protein YndB, AHSA1/START domain [Actinokineospora alba]|uniref:Uncharacterized conserved protein YndB, AHSA1/START domain n=1 Tax=Actinokineospora alba TaxID=504798 RepID=A0A1H0U0A8_9PSEU|nr:SRPBCC family protein [Actinokineospora alba]TDP70819.1 uncharacterized protein YndB with AHSA1/START domain [Actinokineospora alba]SDJ17339.1 Uncharacterized conserved protein YndB, AHSA1/START domain [Actinokineospora alba]SDP59480.1 Uncharacterized conserved protein YndB, AHSA1/START domain [Actinokineospora alba]
MTPVQKSIIVKATQERAFTVFATKMGTWWPADHHIGDGAFADIVIEPKPGGGWFERGQDGAECDWGSVLAYDPHDRFVLTWNLQGDWTYDPDTARASEVEVRFIPEGPDTTRVELEHRHLERHGEAGEDIQTAVDSERGWPLILTQFADATVA